MFSSIASSNDFETWKETKERKTHENKKQKRN
jgi:hypothetical protein